MNYESVRGDIFASEKLQLNATYLTTHTHTHTHTDIKYFLGLLSELPKISAHKSICVGMMQYAYSIPRNNTQCVTL